MSDHELVSIEANKDEKTIEMEMFIPASNATGKYVIDGKVAVLVLDPYDPAAYRLVILDSDWLTQVILISDWLISCCLQN